MHDQYTGVNYDSVLLMSTPYRIDRANSIVFTSKRLPLQPVSSKRNHEVADKFRKMGCLNVYGRKRGYVGVNIYPTISENSLDQALSWTSNLAIITNDYKTRQEITTFQ